MTVFESPTLRRKLNSLAVVAGVTDGARCTFTASAQPETWSEYAFQPGVLIMVDGGS
jgi:hypothetical protein